MPNLLSHLVSSCYGAYRNLFFARMERDLDAAYQKLKVERKEVTPTLFPTVDQPVANTSNIPIPDSIESTLHINADNNDKPFIYDKDHVCYIQRFSKLEWNDFLKTCKNKVSITLGYRQAFSPSINVDLTHAVFLLKNEAEENNEDSPYGIYGYFRGEDKNEIKNDFEIPDCWRRYHFYDGLTVSGNVSNAFKFVSKVEEKANKVYFNGVTNNCFTPILKALIKSDKYGLKTPENFLQRLLITVPKEQNQGMGITSNQKLSGKVEDIIEEVLHPSRPKC